ncbi:hypothetical protein OG749_42755 [Streptomyces nojiriensis]
MPISTPSHVATRHSPLFSRWRVSRGGWYEAKKTRPAAAWSA